MTARSCAAVRADTAAGQVKAADTLTAAIDRAHEVDAGREGLNIFAWRDDDDARRQAVTIGDRLADTTPGALLGEHRASTKVPRRRSPALLRSWLRTSKCDVRVAAKRTQ